MPINLTTSQQEAIDAFKTYLESDSQVFMLKGAAGTGKTTLVNEFLKIITARKRESVLMAPTGRAAFIIGSKTGHVACTIHRGIYVLSGTKLTSQNKEEEDDGGIHLQFALKSNNDSQDAVYIVDESSMVSDSYSHNEAFSFGSGCLLTDLFTFARGRKIVFVGDHDQLPPIGMNFSPALDKDYVENAFGCKATVCTLQETMRQSDDSMILSNVLKIRDAIERKTFIEFKLTDGDDTFAENTDLLKPYFKLSSDKPDAQSAIVTYSNKQALDYNLAVRRHYYGEDSPRLVPGELLMICRNNYSYEHELFNGNIVKIEASQPDSEITVRQVRVKMGKNRIEQVELRFRRATICFAAAGKRVSLSVTLLDNFLDDPQGAVSGLLARALIVDFNNRLPEEIKSRYNEIRRLMRTKEKLSAEQKRLCETYANLLAGDPYYNAVICKYGYAMTCHKAQGGEWDNVFVDMCRFGGTANEDYFRWAYTALTRASKKIWHFRSPDFNYISNLVVEEIKPSSNIKVSNYGGDKDFRESRFNRLSELAKRHGLGLTEDTSKSYQHIVTFKDSDGGSATFQLWYNAKGYSGKDILLNATSEEFASLCRPLIDKSLTPEIVPFSSPDRPFAEKLVSFIKSQLEETGIGLLDITQENYQDVFHLKTDGIAQIGLTYTAKGNYTYMRLTSSLGPQDNKLQELRNRFI